MSKRRDYVKQLKAEGWQQLGEGHFSVAYGKGDRVIKVSHRNCDGKGPKNDAYLAFASWVVLNGNDNPHLPKIHSLEIVHDEDDDGDDATFYTVELEKLTPLTDYDNGSEEYSLFRAARNGFYRDGDGDETEVTWVSEPNSMERNCDCDGCMAKVQAWNRQNGEAVEEAEAEISSARLAAAEEAGRILREAFKDVASFDLHDGNAMIRETAKGSQLVITDPIAWVHDYGTQEAWLTDALSALNPQYSLPF
jgi:hypothetical protein